MHVAPGNSSIAPRGAARAPRRRQPDEPEAGPPNSRRRSAVAADYAVVGVFLAVGVVFVALNVEILSRALTWLSIPRKSLSPLKHTTYECGEEPLGESWIRFHVRYYLYALVYIVFAVETVFLFPWAVVFRQLGLAAFIEMVVFITILMLGLGYAWCKGALEWV